MKYTAFISYNSKDDRWAKWLQRKLEAYSMPVVIRNEQDEVVRREEKPEKLRVFRYRADLNTVSLNEGLAKELDDARWLIVICSPNSAKSAWVGKEIQHFLDTGRRERLDCDALVTAVGLIPDRALCRDMLTGGQLPPWLRLCGNCESVHALVDGVTREAERLGAEPWE